MIKTIKEVSLSKALNYVHLPELPKRFIEEEDRFSFWTRAIVLVRKRDLTQSYAVAKRDGTGKITYIADFGTMSPIAGLIFVFPFTFFDFDKYMPYPNPQMREDALIRFLGGDTESIESVRKLTDNEIFRFLLEIGVQEQFSDERDAKERIENIRMSIIRSAMERSEQKNKEQKERENSITSNGDDIDVPAINTVDDIKVDAEISMRNENLVRKATDEVRKQSKTTVKTTRKTGKGRKS